jgi:2,5-diketo-D-gluconate reductase B
LPPSMVEEGAQHAFIFCNQVEYHPYKAQDKLLKQAREIYYLLTAWRSIVRGPYSTTAYSRRSGKPTARRPRK